MEEEAQRPTLSHVARRSFQASTQEGRAFLQLRIGMFARLMFILMAGYFSFIVVARTLFGQLDVDHDAIGALAAATALTGLGGLWIYTRGKPRSETMVNWLDISCALDPGALIAVGVFMMRDLPIAVFAGFFGCSMMIFGRALIVPSTARRTLFVSAITMMPLLSVNGYVTYTTPAEQLMLPPGLQAALFVAWATIAVVLTAYGSGVIYGLRQQVHKARQLGQYTLLEKMGEGGMGVVYRARHAMLRRATAIKLLPPAKAGEQQLMRFEREVQHTAELTHPNTVHIYDYGRSPDGVFYYAMELLDGIDLDELVERFGAQPEARVVHLLEQICGSLNEAHQRGLVHRDVKPANIYLCHRGGIPDVIKVLDFGLVKELDREGADVTDVNVVAGTPAFLAPETITAPDKIGPAADLYAVGAVAYYLLTGEHVFSGATVVEVCGHHVHSKPEAPSTRLGAAVDPMLEQLILKCLEKTPASRPASARAMLRQLERIATTHPWSDDDADAWWESVKDEINTRPSGGPSAALASTMQVDLTARAGA